MPESIKLEVSFRQVCPWALLPRKIKIDVKAKQEEVRIFEENFQWLRISRSEELCWPWRMGQEIGWVVDCPVNITMDALHDVEARGAPHEQRTLSMLTNCTEVWSYNDDQGQLQRVHYTRNAGWIGLYDYRVGDTFHRMFFTNGQGSVEWVMGWEVRIPIGYFLLLLPYEPIRNLEVIMGVLDAKNLKRPGKSGMSIAIRPTGPVTLKRGQPIARIILLHGDSLRAGTSVEDAAT